MKKGKKLLSMLLAGCLAASAVPAVAYSNIDYSVDGYALVKHTWYDEAGKENSEVCSYNNHADATSLVSTIGNSFEIQYVYDRFGRETERKALETMAGVTKVEEWSKTAYTGLDSFTYSTLDKDGAVESTLYYSSTDIIEVYETYKGTAKDVLLEKEVYTYNGDGACTEEVYIRRDDSTDELNSTKYTNVYDASGNMTQKKYYQNDVLAYTDDMTYDAEGNQLTSTVTQDGSITSETKWEYAVGSVKTTQTDSDGSKSSWIEKFDEYGNTIELTKLEGTDLFTDTWQYTYYDNHAVKTKTEYNDGMPVKQVRYDEAGNETALLFSFDNDGKAVEKINADYFEYVTTKEILAKTVNDTFADVNSSDYFAAPVVWAVNSGITNGTNMETKTFSPKQDCTRAHIVTMLWRAACEPNPVTKNNPFTDVPDSAYYKNAVLWAVENNITKGMTETTFEPNTACNRAQAATFLWRASGEQTSTITANPFTDVADTPTTHWYYNAVLWAVENGITDGMTPTTYEPNTTCSRGHIVTFLYRAAA